MAARPQPARCHNRRHGSQEAPWLPPTTVAHAPRPSRLDTADWMTVQNVIRLRTMALASGGTALRLGPQADPPRHVRRLNPRFAVPGLRGPNGGVHSPRRPGALAFSVAVAIHAGCRPRRAGVVPTAACSA
jgi:hypothetical protein